MDLRQGIETVFAEIRPVMLGIDEGEFNTIAASLVGAPRIFVCGAGRSGLIMKMFAMRLAQAGLQVYAVGDCTTPSISSGDLLFAASGSGSTAGVLLLAKKAVSLGAKISAVSYFRNSPLHELADNFMYLPVPVDQSRPGKVGGTQVLGTLFDQCLQLSCTLLVARVVAQTGQTEELLQGRHANLE